MAVLVLDPPPYRLIGRDVRGCFRARRHAPMNSRRLWKTVERPLKPLPARLLTFVFGSYVRGDVGTRGEVPLPVTPPKKVHRAAGTVRRLAVLRRRLVPAAVLVMSHSSHDSERAGTNTLVHRLMREERKLWIAD